MALQFILGGAGSGKTRMLYDRVIKESMEHPEQKYLVVVPEQFTMQTQKEIIRLHPRHGIMNIDILSFKRLAYRVFEDLGVRIPVVLDDMGKSMVLRKVAAVLRRVGGGIGVSHVIRYRGLTLDPDMMEARLEGRPLELTAREFELLRAFISSPGRVFTREVLLAKIWGYDFFGDERVVDSHIKNLRRKLGVDYIETVRGVGYRAAKENP